MSDLAARVYAAAHLEGEYTLRSGAVSSEYFDKYRFEADPTLLRDVAQGLAEMVPPGTDLLGGLELGGVPLATLVSQLTGHPLRLVRKKAKTYGTCQLVEGGDLHGFRVCLVEDIITSGGAVVDATTALRGVGAVVDAVLCVIDRQAGGREQLASMGVEVRALFTKGEVEAAAAG